MLQPSAAFLSTARPRARCGQEGGTGLEHRTALRLSDWGVEYQGLSAAGFLAGRETRAVRWERAGAAGSGKAPRELSFPEKKTERLVGVRSNVMLYPFL